MRRSSVVSFFLCSLVLAWTAAVGVASGQSAAPGERPSIVTGRQSAGRVLQFEQFAQRWADELDSRAAGHSREAWRPRLSKIFLAADPTNVVAALRATALDDAVAALRGLAARTTAPAAFPDSLTLETMSAGRLGDVGADMTYTPIAPCRIVDTRLAGGAIAGGATASFLATASSYSAQGGNAAGCGVSGEVPGAVVLNVTAVNPAAGGFATVFASGTTRPATASLNYTTGAVVNNTIITKVPDPLFVSDFTIYTLAQSHFVVDLVGFFDTPHATPLECVDTPNEVISVANLTAVAVSPANACPASYTPLSTNCATVSMTLWSHTATSCTVANASGASQTLTFSSHCCRVPGR